MTKQRIAVVGAGWAGISCALKLNQARLKSDSLDFDLCVLEAAPKMGGRARGIGWSPREGVQIPADNGQHMLVGAYCAILALLAQLDLKEADLFHRIPMSLHSTKGIQFQAHSMTKRWPSPWHLVLGGLRSKGIALREVPGLLRFSLALRRRDFGLGSTMADMPLEQWLSRLNLSTWLKQELIRPLCLATLNTPMNIASARVFCSVLRDTVNAASTDSDFLIAKHDLNAVLPSPARHRLLSSGVHLQENCRVKSLIVDQHSRVHLECVTGTSVDVEVFDRVVLASPWHETARLLEPWLLQNEQQQSLWRHSNEAILTVNCYWTKPIRPKLLCGIHQQAVPIMLDDQASDSPGQWFFDRGAVDDSTLQNNANKGHWATVVVSAVQSGAQRSEIEAMCVKQLEQQLGLPAPFAVKSVLEKRATFSCRANATRPNNHSAQSVSRALWLAGDYTIGDYPATLESAVRSGQAAAQLLLDNLN